LGCYCVIVLLGMYPSQVGRVVVASAKALECGTCQLGRAALFLVCIGCHCMHSLVRFPKQSWDTCVWCGCCVLDVVSAVCAWCRCCL
jgi:hypothetical protein